MRKNYKITIFTTEEVVEREFHKKEIAIKTIIEYKTRFYDFKLGLLYERNEGEWNCVCSIKK